MFLFSLGIKPLLWIPTDRSTSHFGEMEIRIVRLYQKQGSLSLNEKVTLQAGENIENAVSGIGIIAGQYIELIQTESKATRRRKS